MKKIFLSLLGLCTFFVFVQAQVTSNEPPVPTLNVAPTHPLGHAIANNPNLKWLSFTEAATEAEKSQKKMLIFVFREDCGFCVKMNRETYSDSTVVQYLNEKYVLALVDGESSKEVVFRDMKFTEAELASALKAPGFPFHVFMEAGKEKLQYLEGIPGYMPPQQFKHILKYIGNDKYLTQEFNAFVEEEKNCQTSGKCQP